jgi:dTDP-4-amino-4,6-dideoxygalactose transaminase
MVVTDDDKLAEKLLLIRNHAEAVVEDMGVTDLTNMVGQNYRLTEIQAAMGREQLKKLDRLIAERQDNCAYIEKQLGDMPGFRPAKIRAESKSAYYMHAFLFDEAVVGVSRKRFVEAFKAELPPTKLRESEGPLAGGGYVKPIYLMPLFQKQVAFGSKGYPFKSPFYSGVAKYEKGMCPVVEAMYEKRLISHDMMRPGMTKEDLDDVVNAFRKVYEHRAELQ